MFVLLDGHLNTVDIYMLSIT